MRPLADTAPSVAERGRGEQRGRAAFHEMLGMPTCARTVLGASQLVGSGWWRCKGKFNLSLRIGLFSGAVLQPRALCRNDGASCSFLPTTQQPVLAISKSGVCNRGMRQPRATTHVQQSPFRPDAVYDRHNPSAGTHRSRHNTLLPAPACSGSVLLESALGFTPSGPLRSRSRTGPRAPCKLRAFSELLYPISNTAVSVAARGRSEQRGRAAFR